MIDRFDYCEGTYLFCSENYSGMGCDLYARMCRLTERFKFKPSPMLSWERLGHEAREVYRAWCERENVDCSHDQAAEVIRKSEKYEMDDDCVAWFIDTIDTESVDNCCLVNFDRSDFVNICMPYTRDLINHYNDCEESVKYWHDQMLEAYGQSFAEWLNITSEHTTIEDVDDVMTAVVNAAMTYLGSQLLDTIREVD